MHLRDKVYLDWPYVGLVIGSLVLLFTIVQHYRDARPTRKTWALDYLRLSWLGLPVYMLHQFEEHGIDAKGNEYAFREYLCEFFGFDGDSSCLVTPAFLFAVNVGTVWIVGFLAGLGAPRHSVFPGSMFALMFVNAIVHIRPAMLDWEYNPGLLTATVMFLPLSVFALYSMYMRGILSTAQLYASLAVGIITHGFLAASIYLLSHTEMDPHGINLLQIINGFVPVVFAAMLPGKGDSVVAKRLGPGDRVPTHHRTRREIIADLIHEGNQEQGAAAVDRKKTQ